MKRLFALVLLAVPLFAADTKLEIDLAGAKTQQRTVQTGNVFVELQNLMPGKDYTVGTQPKFTAPAVPASADANKVLCDAPLDHLWGKVKAATSEAGVAGAFGEAKANSRCNDAAAKQAAVQSAIEEVRGKLTQTVALAGKITPPVTTEIKRETTPPESWKLFLV